MGILVFDVGTSSMRGALLNDKAEILCQFHRKYHPTLFFSQGNAGSRNMEKSII